MSDVKIKSYKYSELSENAQHVVECKQDDWAYDYVVEIDGKDVTKIEYFSDWSKDVQSDFCDEEGYLFNKYGEMINHLIEEEE